MVEIAARYRKTAVGWDEILQPGLPSAAVIQSWRGANSVAEAARAGHRVVFSAAYYLDLMLPASTHYAADPLGPGGLKPEEAARVLGGEACMWTEWASPENIDTRLWPRGAAVAERLWSSARVRDAAAFYERLDAFGRHLERAGSTHRTTPRRMRERLAGGADPPALQILADAVEPVKNYRRGSLQVYRSDLPLNRLVDSVPPESEPARRFAADVDRALAAGPAAVEWGSIRARLAAWRDNHAALRPLIAKSALLAGIGPASEALSEAGSIGIAAVDYFTAKTRPPPGWVSRQAARLENPGYAPLSPEIFAYCVELQKRHNSTDSGARKICGAPAAPGGVLLAIAPAVRKLVLALH
jgi:hexosaminidase